MRRGVRTTRAAAAALVVALVTLPAAPAVAKRRPGGPSAAQVAAAQQAARQRQAAVGTAQAKLAAADAQLAQLGAAAEARVEAYDGAVVRLAQAKVAAQKASAVKAAADADVARERHAMGTLAAADYRQGGRLAMLGLVLRADGPSELLQRAGYVSHIAEQQTSAYARLRAALADDQVASDAARSRLADVQTATTAADSARRAAATAVTQEQQQVAALSQQRADLARQAAVAERHAGQLVAARAAFLEAQREEAARAAAARAAAQAVARAAAEAAAEQASAPTIDAGAPPASSGSGSSASQGETALAYARAQLGKPYEWGASGPDTFDCSGLTMMAWRRAGVSLVHYAASQYQEGTPVTREALRPGDLVFFATNLNDSSTIHHVGIYAGNGMMISAPKTGDVVKYQPAFRADYFGASRP